MYFLNGTGGLSALSLAPGAYTGATFAAELAAKSGRSCTYYPGSNSIQLGYAEGTRIVVVGRLCALRGFSKAV